MAQACYRKLNKYKYQLIGDYSVEINVKPKKNIKHSTFISLSTRGLLTIKKGYAWDGATGVPDSQSIMRGALVHDALYQLMRLGLLDHEKYKDRADEVLRDICKEDGMSTLWSWCVHQGVKLFGASHAAPSEESEDVVVCVP